VTKKTFRSYVGLKNVRIMEELIGNITSIKTGKLDVNENPQEISVLLVQKSYLY
jgi:hypothetical protein